MSRAKGFRRDSNPDARPTFAVYRSAMGANDTAPPDAASLAPFLLGAFDQGGIGSCLPHARVGGIWCAFAAAGQTLEFVPSPLDLYRLGRMIERASDHPGTPAFLLPALDDVGSQPQWMDAAINDWGVRPMAVSSVQDPGDPAPRFSDCDWSNVNQDASFDALVTDAQTIITGQYAITGSEASRGLAVRKSIGLLRSPVEIGGFVDSAYENWKPENGPFERVDFSDPDGGGHGQLIVEYHRDSIGWIYRIRNSWGSGWGVNGDCWVRESFLGQAWHLTALTVRRAS